MTGSYSGFNGAATLSLRKCTVPAPDVYLAAPLQWGRNFIVAEIRRECPIEETVVAASMGPQLYRCGNGIPGQASQGAAACASMGPQLYRCGNLCTLQSSQTSASCFNGAATLSLRKFVAVTQSLFRHIASMGPQLYRCGNVYVIMIMITMATPLQWGRNFIVAEICRGRKTLFFVSELQWGRNFIVAEILITAWDKDASRRLQWGRNFIVAEIRSTCRARPCPCRFNGAATLSLRKCTRQGFT